MVEPIPGYPRLNRLIRFGFVGGLNSAAAYLTFALLIRAGVHYAAATLIGSLMSMLMGFKLHGAFVFRNSGNGRFLRFLAIFLAMYGLSVGIQSLSRQWVNGYLAGGAAALVTIPISFLLNGAFVFRPDRNSGT
ncbi:MAG: GtrA family protein [Acidobacteria bacterium]|nr:GtrA family protein [Acidobacteriota bacterium]